jgi:hypothetical protein
MQGALTPVQQLLLQRAVGCGFAVVADQQNDSLVVKKPSNAFYLADDSWPSVLELTA